MGWPLIEDEHSKEIEKKLNALLKKHETYKNTDKHDIYMKYKNTILFYEYLKNTDKELLDFKYIKSVMGGSADQ